MLLLILELWVELDKCATQIYGILKKFSPGIGYELTNVLLLSSLDDLKRLRVIQDYLISRGGASKNASTIFDQPHPNCFAVQFYDSSSKNSKMKKSRLQIESNALVMREQKKNELAKKMKTYENLVDKRSRSDHLYDEENGIHNIGKCSKCYFGRAIKKLKIDIHEWPLPTVDSYLKTVLFELHCPEVFSIYRDTSWMILADFASLSHKKRTESPEIELNKYEPLSKFATRQRLSRFTLASDVKIFLMTHYRKVKLPVNEEDVIKPNGANFRYFDTKSGSWVPEYLEPRFDELCKPNFPSDSLFKSLSKNYEISCDNNGPSSNSIIASSANIPMGTTVEEYVSLQTLMSGHERRWLQILIELGSSNINFGTQFAAILMSFLALQVGPRDDTDVRGTIHQIYCDTSFCQRLVYWINWRLDEISSVSRKKEVHGMEVLMTLSLKLFELCDDDYRQEAIKLIQKAREITLKWMTKLNEDTDVEDLTISESSSLYLVWTTLLCRRTFIVFCRAHSIPYSLICSYLESSITLHANLTEYNFDDAHLKAALIRDSKMIWEMRFILRESINKKALASVLSKYGCNLIVDSLSNQNHVEFLPAPHEWYVSIFTNASTVMASQNVCLNILTGNLLIDGKPIGKLSHEWTESREYKLLFGNTVIKTIPSELSEMNFKSITPRENYHVHFGTRNGRKIIQLFNQNEHLELFLSDHFRGQIISDLPLYLIDDHCHWLNFTKNLLEIRQISSPWKLTSVNWKIDLSKLIAYRSRSTKKIYLICPHSDVFENITQIFSCFEIPSQIVAIQGTPNLEVYLPRIALTFFVNRNHQLECRELNSEIDPNQDIGTWYGLRSKLVLREIAKKSIPHDNGPNLPINTKTTLVPTYRRTVLIPKGIFSYQKQRSQLEIKVMPHGSYARFFVNEVVGRIDPADSNDQYLKALLHALTCQFNADSLTGRTGTEEAVHCLKSAHCQPTVPLSDEQILILKKIASLTPKRKFHPDHLQVMQVTSWNSSLTSLIQYDGFKYIVDEILKESERLSIFYNDETKESKKSNRKTEILRIRNCVRRNIYSRIKNPYSENTTMDNNYSGNNIEKYRTRMIMVEKCLELIRNQSISIPKTFNLSKTLEKWSNFQGFCQPKANFILSELVITHISEHWGSLVNTMRNSCPNSEYKLSFLLGMISFNKNMENGIIMTLISYAISDKLKELEPPSHLYYHGYKSNEVPSLEKLVCTIKSQYVSQNMYGKPTAKKTKQELEEHEKKLKASNIAEKLLKQWPCSEPKITQSLENKYFNLDSVMNDIRPEWIRLYHNYELSEYLSQVQNILEEMPSGSVQNMNYTDNSTKYQTQKTYSIYDNYARPPKLTRDILSEDIFCHEPIELEVSKRLDIDNTRNEALLLDNKSHGEISILKDIVQRFSKSESDIEQAYAKDLSESLNAYLNKRNLHKLNPKININRLPQDIQVVQKVINGKLAKIKACCDELMPTRSIWLEKAGLWPHIGPVSLLECLRSTSNCKLGPQVKERIIDYAISITQLQQLYRLHYANVKNRKYQISEELENPGHENWDPYQYPDWLLLEIDGDITIRAGQVDVAKQTISPASRKNSVLQMNMGQGKTSCIMPMAAAVLANDRSLARVIIPKALLGQTIVILKNKLGGLVGREVKHFPFTRKLSLKPGVSDAYFAHLQRTKEMNGIVVTLPEHLLSFKLSGHQALSDGRIDDFNKMYLAQKWISNTSRDIIDECDEVLSIRTQLIYPSGTLKVIDGHPDRWEVIENILELVNFHMQCLERQNSDSIIVTRRDNNSFPHFCFVQEKAEKWLISRIIYDICSGKLYPIENFTKDDHIVIEDFISNINISDCVFEKIDSYELTNPLYTKILYLLRGLFAHGILITTLKKRWNVQYGLHHQRDPIAVPYYAKGTPSDQSEWGHPDVALILTCLAFYYEGLTMQQFRQTINCLRQLSDPVQVYHNLVQKSSNIPESLQNWNNLNTEDETQIDELWERLYRSTSVINFFLNKLVFPKHAKQFNHRLQASGWDIPAYLDEDSVEKDGPTPLTTGFSGTNDWKGLLPLTISQQDLSFLSHTNAEVLTYLLQKRNMNYYRSADANGKRLSEIDFLHMITRHKVFVLLDAGAQIMELDNFNLVKTWLKINGQAAAAFYFDKNNKPQILYQNGRQVPFHSSTYSENLRDCLVYLDEAHTRGTDLKLAPDVCGALTIGPNQTKDHTVQAAMRLRQLGTTQSIIFYAPPEVHQSILNLQKKKDHQKLSSIDVVHWLIKQTCLGIKQLLPLYYKLGSEFCHRRQAVLSYPNFHEEKSLDQDHFLSIIRQDDEQSLIQLYGRQETSDSEESIEWHPEITKLFGELRNRSKGYMKSDNRFHFMALQEVEQEREVAFEVQNIVQKEYPIKYYPLEFQGLHADILDFVKSGNLVEDPEGYEPVFNLIARSSVGKKYGVQKDFNSERFFISVEFGRIVKREGKKDVEHLTRPVNWILWNNNDGLAMIIVPEEAEVIIPILRKQECAVHLITYAAPITRKMLLFNDFNHYNLKMLPLNWSAPSWLRIEIGMFSSRLYFDLFEYDSLLRFLQVKEEDGKIIEDYNQENNHSRGFLESITRPNEAFQSMTSKHLSFLQDWITFHRRGQNFGHTSMGFICQGRPIHANDNYFSRLTRENSCSTLETEDTACMTYSMKNTVEKEDYYQDIFDSELPDNEELDERANEVHERLTDSPSESESDTKDSS